MDINGFNSLNYQLDYSNYSRDIEFNDNNTLTITNKEDNFIVELEKFQEQSFFSARGNYVEQSYTFDIASTGYEGKELSKLSQEEATELVGENGFFGIEQTSNRVAEFVLNGADDDLDRLQAGREGIILGYNQATEIWGEELPEISQVTFEKTLELIDERIKALGGSIIDEFV